MSSTTRFLGGSAGRTLFGFSPYAAVVSLACLLWGLFSGFEVYGNAEHGFSLLAMLGAVGCLGHLAVYVYRSSDRLTLSCSVLEGVSSLEARHSDGVRVASAEWPLLVTLLFGPFSMLLAGLGGWV